MGDALAIAVLEQRGFKEEDFAILHPGGILGKRLLLRVEDIMHRGSAIPLVAENDSMKDTLIEMTSKRLGIAGVVDEKKNLVGVVTDGDLRRAIEKYNNVLDKKASEIMTTTPKQIRSDALAARALHVMEEHAITSLFVYKGKKRNRAVGIVHLHDLLKEGII
jgi:arabinose-5-phosphate isomerase